MSLQVNGQAPLVLDSGELLKDPGGVLAKLCAQVKLPFESAMLSWKPGPRPEDGIWAKHWYANVHRSSGFERQPTSDRPLPDFLVPLCEEAMPLYKDMFNHAIKAKRLTGLRCCRNLIPGMNRYRFGWGTGSTRGQEAKVSVFDSSVQGGDAVWEGLRVYDGGVFCLDRHLARLFASAHALAFQNVPTEEYVRNAIFATLKANGMRDGVHIRLTLTRGEKITSGMDPRLNQKGPCLIVLAEWKPVVYDNETGIRVVTSAIIRNSPRHLDSKIHHNNLLNNIQAKIQANVAGVDAALMLDVSGFVSELNDTNIFMAKNGALLHSTRRRLLAWNHEATGYRYCRLFRHPGAGTESLADRILQCRSGLRDWNDGRAHSCSRNRRKENPEWKREGCSGCGPEPVLPSSKGALCPATGLTSPPDLSARPRPCSSLLPWSRAARRSRLKNTRAK